MVKLFVIGDPHFKSKNTDETDLMEASIISELNKVKVDGIVVLGDILDRHGVISSSVLTRSIKFLDKLRNISKLYILIGNHDLKSNDQFFSEDHPFLALKYWNNTMVADKVIYDTINDKKFIFVPYVPPRRFHEALDHLPFDYRQATCIFAHQEFKGANLGSQVSETGDAWNINDPPVISGHIHDYQELDNITYIGTPIQHTYSDLLERYVGLFTFEDNKITKKLIQLQNIIRKKIIKLTPEELSDYNIETDPNVKIKVKIECEQNQPPILAKHVKIIQMVKTGRYLISYKLRYHSTMKIETGTVTKTEKFSKILIDMLKSHRDVDLYYIYNNIINEK